MIRYKSKGGHEECQPPPHHHTRSKIKFSVGKLKGALQAPLTMGLIFVGNFKEPHEFLFKIVTVYDCR